MALELEMEGAHIQMIRAVELVMAGRPDGHALPVNIDGAIAAVCGDIGIPAETANALFIISRVPGIAAQAQEERAREHPMRQIDPKDHVYDGAGQRRLPDKRRTGR
jgi:citrate synthase